jgi:hypothetical protein
MPQIPSLGSLILDLSSILDLFRALPSQVDSPLAMSFNGTD